MNDHEIDICEKHIHQAEAAADKIAELSELSELSIKTGWHLYHSPFLRTRRTKDIILKELQHDYIFPTVNENPLLSERRWGNLRNIIETEKDVDKYFDFFFRPDGGESFMDCYQRCVTFDNMIKNQVCENDNVIIIGHGEQIKCYLMHLLGWTLEEFNEHKNPENCEVVMVKDGVLETSLRKRN
jgi:broad specificity phosphatase PhoE